MRSDERFEIAQEGLRLLKKAILEEIDAAEHALTHAAIVNSLGLRSDFEGKNQNYLSWSILGLLVNEGAIKYTGERLSRVYYTRQQQLR